MGEHFRAVGSPFAKIPAFAAPPLRSRRPRGPRAGERPALARATLALAERGGAWEICSPAPGACRDFRKSSVPPFGNSLVTWQ